ncbi:hypothetical protein VTI74DRAFT_6916 [Chaetomium olivicolor]
MMSRTSAGHSRVSGTATYLDYRLKPDVDFDHIQSNMKCAKFHDQVWGFVIYRCSEGNQTAWVRLLEALGNRIQEDLRPSTTSHEVRDHFRSWVQKDLEDRLRPDATNLDDYAGWLRATSTPRYEYCLFVDDICLESVDHPGIDSPVVKLLCKNWESPFPLEERNYTVPAPFHDGATEYDEEDVGWMYMPLQCYLDKYAVLGKCDWDDQYVRPPYIDGSEDESNFGNTPTAISISNHWVPIGQQGDGVAYLRFLTALKSKLPNKSVSIAAPASYWYLKAFPIDRIAAVIDYIVYNVMTYDLHGQWDYGNPNAYDSCPTGKCIRSHVTKAGVPNSKIFVGEASYGRSFHMAVDGCWGPMCDFTGTRLQSDAEARKVYEVSRLYCVVHDHDSNTDVLLYEGDYISYMTPVTMRTRQADWKKLNFAGTINWAIDLQAFGQEDFDVPVTIPPVGEEACIVGDSADLNADSLCQFACAYGFCPEPTCACDVTGPARALPAVVSTQDFMAGDEMNVDLQRLCKFACKYGYCPPDSCTTPVVDEYEDGSVDSSIGLGGIMDRDKYNNLQNQCMLFKYPKFRIPDNCLAECIDEVEAAKAEGRTTNYGFVGNFPLDQDLPWTVYPGSPDPENVYVPGKCVCGNMLVNFVADALIDALPIIAQLVLDVGLQAIPGIGKILDAGLDAVATAAQLVSYAYPPDQGPIGGFSWWLSPCGGDNLVPDEIKQVFETLSSIADGVSSFKLPKNIRKGSGKKGDPANPTDRSKPKAGTGTGPNGTGSGAVKKKKKCRVPPKQSSIILGAAKNTLRLQSCVTDANGDASTTKDDHVVTSLTFGPTPTTIEKVCSKAWTQACYHYSSTIAQNNAWDTLKCVHGSVAAAEASYLPGPDKRRR